MCPHTTVYVSSYYNMCVLMLLYVCPRTTVRRQVGLFAHVCSRMLTYAHVCSRMQAEDRAYSISPPRPQREAQEQREKARAQVVQVLQVARDAGTWPQEGREVSRSGGGGSAGGGASRAAGVHVHQRGGDVPVWGEGGGSSAAPAAPARSLSLPRRSGVQQ